MCMECRRFSQTMASEWQTAFVVSHKMPWYALLTAVNYNKSLEKLQDFFICSRPRPTPWCIVKPLIENKVTWLVNHSPIQGSSKKNLELPWSDQPISSAQPIVRYPFGSERARGACCMVDLLVRTMKISYFNLFLTYLLFIVYFSAGRWFIKM